MNDYFVICNIVVIIWIEEKEIIQDHFCAWAGFVVPGCAGACTACAFASIGEAGNRNHRDWNFF